MKIYLIIWVSLLFALSTHAQSVVRGRVSDDQGNPIPFANIYLENTTTGTTSDIAGNFELDMEADGTYRLVCSNIGFITQLKSIMWIDDQPFEVNFKLKEDVQYLENIEIEVSRDKKWEKNLKEFEKFFLGGSSPISSNNCTIANPYVIDFESTGDFVAATAKEPLIIYNYALGYTIRYDLVSFILNKKQGLVQYQGYPFFEHMTPESTGEIQAWLRNRKEAYRGSKMHFLRALNAGDTFDEGFVMYQEEVSIDDLDVLKPSNQNQLTDMDILSAIDHVTNQLACSKFLRIEYVKRQVVVPLNGISLTANETSWIRLPNQKTNIDLQGFFTQPLEVQLIGEFGKEGISMLLPLDYEENGTIDLPNVRKQVLKNWSFQDSVLQRDFVFLDFEAKPKIEPTGRLAFDAYLFSGNKLEPGSNSKVLYVELIGPNCDLINIIKFII